MVGSRGTEGNGMKVGSTGSAGLREGSLVALRGFKEEERRRD